MSSQAVPAGRHSRGERLREELRDYVCVSAYLFVCFSVLLLYKMAVLRDAGAVALMPFGIAAVKAIVLGKFALLGRAMHVGERAAGDSVRWRIVRRSVSFTALLLVLSVIEEFVVGWWHGHPAAQTLADVGSAPGLTLIAGCAVLMLVIAPFIAALEVSNALGPGVMAAALRKSGSERSAGGSVRAE